MNVQPRPEMGRKHLPRLNAMQMGSFDFAHAALIFILWSFVVAGAVSFVLREPDGLPARGCSRELDAAAAWRVCAQCSGDSVQRWV